MQGAARALGIAKLGPRRGAGSCMPPHFPPQQIPPPFAEMLAQSRAAPVHGFGGDTAAERLAEAAASRARVCSFFKGFEECSGFKDLREPSGCREARFGAHAAPWWMQR